jgi:hypothetical protein
LFITLYSMLQKKVLGSNPLFGRLAACARR